jgi:transforming growth factor-beta-induced protein
MKKLVIFIMVLVFAGFVACNESDDLIGNLPEESGLLSNSTNTDKTIAEVASDASQFSILVDALVEANLVDPFTQPGNFTVFAPTNDAFADFLAENGFTGLSDIPQDLLKTVLLYHVVPTRIALNRGFSDIYVSSLSKASNDNYLSLYLHDFGSMKVNYSSIDKDIVNTSNGYIYTIDKVLVPPRIHEFIEMNRFLLALDEALELAGLSIDDTDGITLFAPVNEAFESKLDDLGLSSLSAIGSTALSSILKSHVVNGYFLSSQLSGNATVNTLNPDKDIEIWGSGRDVSLEDKDIDAITVDIQAVNGVMHTIEGVIIP